MDPNNKEDQASLETLESNDQVVAAPQSQSGSSEGNGSVAPTPGPEPPKPPARHRLKQLLARTNIYMGLFVVLLVILGIGGTVLYMRDTKKAQSNNSLASQSLSAEELKQLANDGVTIGDPKQVLTVQSNAIFAAKMLVQGDLEVAGKLLVGSSLSLTGVTVSGNSTFDDVQITRNLSVSGNGAVQGRLTAQSLATSGSAAFGGAVTAGQLTTNSLNLNGNLVITKHIVIGGSSPGRSNGGALGSGGTSSVSGSDAAGTITINTGGSPGAGCFITVSFAQKYNQTPRVLLTPVGSAAANLNYYMNRSSSNFSVCTTNAAAAGQSFGFDYFVVE